MTTFIALVVAFFTTTLPHADIVLTGRVTDALSSQPIVGAQVVVAETKFGNLTTADGAYRITLPASYRGSQIVLKAQYIGYQTRAHRMMIGADSVQVDFALNSSPVEIAALEIIGESRMLVPGDQVSSKSLAVSGSLRISIAPREPANTESYNYILENGFRLATAEPLSTFSIDVDRASYSNIRRFIRQGQMPPKDAVRIEEMTNYFPYAYTPPSSSRPFSITTEVTAAPWQPQHRLVRIGLQAKRIDLERMPPNNLVFLVDVSGSMMQPNKLPLLKQSLALLVNELRPIDRVAMVVYAGRAGLVLEATPGTQKARILEALESLEAGGSTAGGAGLRLAYKVALENRIENGNNRVILATDGDFNVGVSSDAEMIRLVEEHRSQGTFMTVLGFGMGNLKDSKLEQIADHGNGNFAYIDDLMEARKTLVSELGGTLLTVAKDVKIQVEFNPARVRAYRLLGYENRLLQNEDFEDDKKDAGEIGAGHSVTALYEVVPVGVTGTVETNGGSLRYQEPRIAKTAASRNELLYVNVRYKQPNANKSELLQHAVRDGVVKPSVDTRFAASVAAFGMLLRESAHRGVADYDLVLELANNGLGEDVGGYRREFVRLVEQARALRPSAAADSGPER
jgi:Ca-activated chloride channel homolog